MRYAPIYTKAVYARCEDDLTDEADTYYEVKFDQVFLAGPTITEQDGVSRALIHVKHVYGV